MSIGEAHMADVGQKTLAILAHASNLVALVERTDLSKIPTTGPSELAVTSRI